MTSLHVLVADAPTIFRFGVRDILGREALSRGQEKLTALACVLAQARAYAEDCRDWPIVCLDDLPSELDLSHSRYALDLLLESEAQTIVTGTHFEPELLGAMHEGAVFHVEHGDIRPA